MAKKKIIEQKTVDYRDPHPVFTSEMKETYTILIPNMLPTHFEILKTVFVLAGYKHPVILENETRSVIDEGLKHVHNDTCYPALCVIGQYLDALKSGKYDPDKTAVLITQSGGGCRASNYVPLIRKALHAEFPNVPVLSLNFSGYEKDSGMEITLPTLLRLAYGILYGDVLMSLYNSTKPYAKDSEEPDRVRAECVELVTGAIRDGSYRKYKRIVGEMLDRFSRIEKRDEKHIRVGIVGEIYVKYSPLGNSGLEKFLLSEGCEPVVPALMDFVFYCIVNTINDARLYGKNKKTAFVYRIIYKMFLRVSRRIIKMFRERGLIPPHDFEHLRRHADRIIHQGVKMGEGWLIPAEMAALAEEGTENIVCAQPFGCLPNHIVGKGASRAVKALYPDVNIVAIDYDPSATKVNQENRIKLMLAAAREKERERGK